MPFQGLWGNYTHYAAKGQGFFKFFIHRFMFSSARPLSALHEAPHRGILACNVTEEKGRNRYVAYSERTHSPDCR